MNKEIKNFIQQNSPDGGFLQSEEWQNFQESVGRNTFRILGDNFWANIIEHKLPVIGKYFYIPRGPIMLSNIRHESCSLKIQEIIKLAKKNSVGWIRIEPANQEILNRIGKDINYKIIKALHDMQPKEILVVDISKSDEEILSEMKQKTRYNIRLAEKKGVKIIEDKRYMDEFIRLTKIMAKRHGIVAHPDEYYQKMIKKIKGDTLKLYIAEYQGKIIAANLVMIYGNTCTYLHGASDDDYRNVMAPFLLQWKQIKNAKDFGCKKYDFGGVKINSKAGKSWEGVTRFKTGFSPNVKPVEFPGSYDIIVIPVKYWIYKIIQKLKNVI